MTPAERDLAKQTFHVHARIEGPNAAGVRQPDIILRIHPDREFYIIRFDDDTFVQKPLTKLLQQEFTLSSKPMVTLDRIPFESGDPVRVKWWTANPKPGTVLMVEGN